MEEGEHNSVVFPSYEIDDQEISQGIANLRDFSRDVCTTFLQYVPMTSRWETLTSNIKGYKNFCDALRPSLGKEIGTTVFALNGVDAKLRHQTRKLKIYAVKTVALLFNDLLY